MTPDDFILYTYQTVDGKLVCDAYGPSTSSACETAGAHLQQEAAAAGESPLTIMVLELKPLPSV